MSGFGQGWLVARREIRERIRSKALWAGTALMLVVVVAVIVVPALADTGKVTRDVGFTGAVPDDLPAVAVANGDAVDVEVRVHHYDNPTAGEEAVRDEDIDVLVVDARRLQWRADADERVRAVLTAAIQLVAVQERASDAQIDPDQLAALVAPVPVDNEELGIAAGRSPDDETAAYVMSILLFVALVTYGQLVLTGVVQEKSSRVVEVLLARMPARNLLAGKVAGIGLLGFAQFAITALAALIATLAVESVDIPAISGDVLAWVVVWFVLGYVLYALAYGAFGSLASRTEDASSIAAPATTVLIVGYWASFIAVSNDPEGGWAQLVSQFPATAPFAMPGRIALGVTAWWEPVTAVVFTLAAIVGLVAFAGRVYSGGILHGGSTLKLRDAWQRGSATPGRAAPAVNGVGQAASNPPCELPVGTTMARETTDSKKNAILVGIAVLIGTVVFALARDAIWGVIAGAGFFAIASKAATARNHPSR